MKKIVILFAAVMATSPVWAFDINVSASSQNQVISGNKSYSVPQGTPSVKLSYNIFSAEYPVYVTAQSIYNDVWSLSVSGPGGTLFEITRQVNSQLTQEPVWRSDSTTGDIEEVIDVSTLTANGDITLQLVGTSMNVGDSALTTTVRASLVTAPPLTITSVTADAITTANSGNYYSVPASGAANTLHRNFTVEVTKAPDIEVKKATVTLQGAADLMKVMDGVTVPSMNNVEVLAQTDLSMTLKVRVTVQNPVSSVNGTPPPARDISYLFQLEGEDANGIKVTANKTASGKRALWRMGSVLPGRYGARDPGGDDWGAQATYAWIQAHSTQINEVDDISGEHGRNIGHNTHQFGTDIDTYHFYRFPNATSGTDNYNRLHTAVISAFGTLLPNPTQAATDDRNRLIAYVGATRTGLANLEAQATVAHLYYAIGTAGGGLPNGWAQSLIRNGTVTRTVNNVTQTLNLGLGAWTNAKLTHNSVHNNHVHVTLDRTAIGD